MSQVLLFADDRALAAFLGGAATLRPGISEAPCQELDLQGPAPGALTRALLFDGEPLPASADPCNTSCVLPAALRGGKLEVRAQGKQHSIAAEALSEPRALAQILHPLPWRSPPAGGEVLYLCELGDDFARFVSEHLELGRDDLRTATAETPWGTRVLLDSGPPAWFLLERWVEGERVRAFRRSPGARARRVYVEWGYEHPLERWLRDPPEGELLLITADGQHLRCAATEFSDLAQLLDLEPGRFPTTELSPAPAPPRLSVALRLEGRVTPLDPTLWLLPGSEQARLERLLAQTPEDELRNLLLATIEGPDGAPLFAVREVLAGRAPRLLPLGERCFAPHPGLPNLLLPCDERLAPPLRDDRYATAFGLTGGILTLLERGPADELTQLTIPERAFQSIERLIDFVVHTEARRLEAIVREAPFALEEFAEVDLEVPRVEREHERLPATPQLPQEEEEPKPKTRGRLLGKLRDFFVPSPSEERPALPATPSADPGAAQLAELEATLTLEAPTAEAWFKLGRLQGARGGAEEALRAFENGLWLLPAGEGFAALQQLANELGGPLPPRKAPESASDLYRAVLTYCAAVADGEQDASRYRELTERVYEALRAQQVRLRKKTRWLLWAAVGRETGDAIELERQREDLLSELVLRGIEDREVPPFVRRVLLDEFGYKAATGSGASEALSFLEAASGFSGSLSLPALQAKSSAHVAWLLAVLGESKAALATAKRVERTARTGREDAQGAVFGAAALARLGAVRERAAGREQGLELIERSLHWIVSLATAKQSSHVESEAAKAFADWFSALEDARSASPGVGAPLLEEALERLRERSPELQAKVLSGAAQAWLSLGVEEQGLTLARTLLASDLRYELCEKIVLCLEDFTRGRPLGEADAGRVLEFFLANPRRIDEISIQMFEVVLRAHPQDPWELGERVRAQLNDGGHVYAARLIGLASLRRLAELRDRRRGPELLDAALADAWTHKAPPGAERRRGEQRMRLVTRLASLVPRFGMRDRGLALLGDIQRRAESEEDPYIRNELLMSAGMAISKLGDSLNSFKVLDQIAAQAMASFRAAELGENGPPAWLLFETIEECAHGVIELGETGEHGQGLLARIAELARETLKRLPHEGHLVSARFFACKALVRTSHSYLAMGNLDLARALFDESYEHVKRFVGQDLVDLLEQLAEVAGELDGRHRYGVAHKVIELAQARSGGSPFFERGLVDLIDRLTTNIVRGESAFTAALKRWKGREERLIRDRVAVEEFGES
ncbi:MAG: hypothetical protein KDD82_07120 [Planctomycetes bacterium]|nr:hypothetical protein [Planctomycetota bacterium]